jgi:predicted MFS family arabinose efflux permease
MLNFTGASRLGRWFPALAEPDVRLYLGGQALSMMGTWVLDITLNLLVWQLSGSPLLLGVLNFVLYGPGVLVVPLFSGRLTAANARRCTLWVLAAALAVALALAVLTALDRLTIGLLFALALARGVLNGMEVPSRQMLLTSSIRSPERMASAVALNTVVFQLARMLGPALAGVVFATAGPLCAFSLTALGQLCMIACVFRLRGAASPAAAPGAGAGRGGVRGALDFVRADRFASLFLPVLVCMGLFAGSYQTLVPVLADHVFGNTTRWTSAFFGAVGVGAVVVSVLLSTPQIDRLVGRCQVSVPWLAVLALVGLGLSRWPLLSLVCFVSLGACMAFIATATNAVMHQRVPQHARGGLIALFLMSFVGTIPLGQLLAGWLAQWLSVQATFLWLAAGLGAALLLLFVPRWRALGRLELDARRI